MLRPGGIVGFQEMGFGFCSTIASKTWMMATR
jgi:hypothetical protein